MQFLNKSRLIHLIPAVVNDTYIIRFCVNSKKADINDIMNSWNIIKSAADHVVDQPLHSLDQFESKKFSDLIASVNLSKIRRSTLKKMLSDPSKRIISAKGRGKLTKANSIIFTDVQIISENIL